MNRIMFRLLVEIRVKYFGIMKLMAKKDYENLDREALIKEIESLKKRKKFGLVWEDKSEDVIVQCKERLPVFNARQSHMENIQRQR